MSNQSKTIPAQPLPNGRGTGGQIGAILLKYLVEHPGVELFRSEIVEATGLTEQQVRVGMSNLRSADKLGARDALETVISGQVWRWHPNKAKAEETEVKAGERLYREVGKTREGDSILQADDGSLWRATEL